MKTGWIDVEEFIIKKLGFTARGSMHVDFTNVSIKALVGVKDQGSHDDSGSGFEVKDINLVMPDENFDLVLEGNLAVKILRVFGKNYLKRAVLREIKSKLTKTWYATSHTHFLNKIDIDGI